MPAQQLLLGDQSSPSPALTAVPLAIGSDAADAEALHTGLSAPRWGSQALFAIAESLQTIDYRVVEFDVRDRFLRPVDEGDASHTGIDLATLINQGQRFSEEDAPPPELGGLYVVGVRLRDRKNTADVNISDCGTLTVLPPTAEEKVTDRLIDALRRIWRTAGLT